MREFLCVLFKARSSIEYFMNNGKMKFQFGSLYSFSGRGIGPLPILLPDNTQHSLQTDTHAPGGIRNRNPSKRSASDSSFRPLGHRVRHRVLLLFLNVGTSVMNVGIFIHGQLSFCVVSVQKR